MAEVLVCPQGCNGKPQALCRCGMERRYHHWGHPHAAPWMTPGCPGFREPSLADTVRQQILWPEPPEA